MPARRSARARGAHATPDDILVSFRPEIRALAGDVRAFVRATVPSAEERAYPGWWGIGYVDAQAGYFCGLFPQKDHVRLGFEHGAALPDPNGLLTAGGKQVRYVVLRPGEPIPERPLARLIEAAILHGAVRG
jgi:hypothetical protein